MRTQVSSAFGAVRVGQQPPGGGQLGLAQGALDAGQGFGAGRGGRRDGDGVGALLGQAELAGGLPQGGAVGDDTGEQGLHQGRAPRLALQGQLRGGLPVGRRDRLGVAAEKRPDVRRPGHQLGVGDLGMGA
jgi:hypothetical protein